MLQRRRLDGNEKKKKHSSRKLARVHYHSGSIGLFIACQCGRAKWSVAGRPPWWTPLSESLGGGRDANTEPEVPSDAGPWSCYTATGILARSRNAALCML